MISHKRKEKGLKVKKIPVARSIPIEKTHKSIFGCMKGMIKIKKDIAKPIEEKWDAFG